MVACLARINFIPPLPIPINAWESAEIVIKTVAEIYENACVTSNNQDWDTWSKRAACYLQPFSEAA